MIMSGIIPQIHNHRAELHKTPQYLKITQLLKLTVVNSTLHYDKQTNQQTNISTEKMLN